MSWYIVYGLHTYRQSYMLTGEYHQDSTAGSAQIAPYLKCRRWICQSCWSETHIWDWVTALYSWQENENVVQGLPCHISNRTWSGLPDVFCTVRVKSLEAPLSPVMVSKMVFAPSTSSFALIWNLDTEEAVGHKAIVQQTIIVWCHFSSLFNMHAGFQMLCPHLSLRPLHWQSIGLRKFACSLQPLNRWQWHFLHQVQLCRSHALCTWCEDGEQVT